MKPPSNFFIKIRGIFLPIIILTIFISGVLISTPVKEAFEYNPDEGFTLIRTLLFLEGFSLYKEIWSDVPPLFTVILSYWLKLFGLSVYHARILTLIFSSILLWAFYQTIKISKGHFCGFMGVLFLILSTDYIRLSTSVMIGLPAFTLAMLSILCVTLYKKSQAKYLLALSGIFMALSLQLKLFTMFLIPLIILEIIQAKRLSLKGEKQQNYLFSPLFLWFGSFLATYFSITVIFFHFDFCMLIQTLLKPHYIARSAFNLPKYSLLARQKMIFNDFDIVLLALTGMVLLIKKKKWQSFFPFAWLILALLILLNHKPIHTHYYLLLSIPISWLAAISFSEFFTGIKDKKNQKTNKPKETSIFFRQLTAILIIIPLLMIPVKCKRIHKNLGNEVALTEYKTIEILLKYKNHTRWIITDRPIFAFYTNILTPPELACITHKRRMTKNLSPDYILHIMKKYKPEQILLQRFNDYDPKILSYIEKNYYIVYRHQEKPHISQSCLLPSYQGKIPLIKWLRYTLWHYKLKVRQAKAARRYERSKHSNKKLALYIRKDIPKADLSP